MKQEKEIWRPVVGYEGYYEVSNLGRVKSLLGYGGVKERILKPCTHKKGYQSVPMYYNGKMKMYLIHRLVAMAFIPNPDNLPQVNHKDENKTNNIVSNLEWVSAEINCNHGTRNIRMGGEHRKQVLCIELNKMFNSLKEAYAWLGKPGSHISACCKGKRTIAYGYHWKYVNEKEA